MMKPLTREHPDQRVLLNHRGDRPIRVHWIHAEQIADLLGFRLHGRRTQIEILPDLAGRNVRRLRGIKV